MTIKKKFLLLGLISSPILHSQDMITFDKNESDLRIFDRERDHTYVVPNINSVSNIDIRLPGVNKKKEGAKPEEEKKEEDKKEEPKKEEPKPEEMKPSEGLDRETASQVSALILKANDKFYRGNAHGALTFLNQAEALDPHNARVQAMKGSLLIETHQIKEGIQYWKDSLKGNPNQPGLRKKLLELDPNALESPAAPAKESEPKETAPSAPDKAGNTKESGAEATESKGEVK